MRLNLYMKDDLYDQLKKALPPRRINQFVNRVITDKLNEIKRGQIEDELREAIFRINKIHSNEFKEWEQETHMDGLEGHD